MMDDISPWMYLAVAALVTAALGCIEFRRAEFAGPWRTAAWSLLMGGWAFMALRFWVGWYSGDREISAVGATGLVLLAAGTVLSTMRRPGGRR